MTIIEVFKVFTPIIIFLFSVIVIPLGKRAIDSSKTFFELPANVKEEAITYLLEHKKTNQPLKILSHRIKMEGYRLDENVIFSQQIIKFFYKDKVKNARFCRYLLKAKGLYVKENNKISIRLSMIWLTRGPLGKRKISYAKPVFCTDYYPLSVTSGIYPVPT